jgi:CRISPR-associated protein Cas2
MRGFLSSSLLELVPGVYCGARVTPAVRERIWAVVEAWFLAERDASIVMVWREPSVPGEQAVRILGAPPVDLVEHEGIILTRHPLQDT